jgi:hypothetical protein
MSDAEKTRCRYCGKERPRNELKEAVIIGRGRNERTGKACVTTERLLFCHDTGCAGNEQMAREG